MSTVTTSYVDDNMSLSVNRIYVAHKTLCLTFSSQKILFQYLYLQNMHVLGFAQYTFGNRR